MGKKIEVIKMVRQPVPKTTKGIQSEIKRNEKKIKVLLNKIRQTSQKIYGQSPPNVPYSNWNPELKTIHKEFMYNIRRQKRLYNNLAGTSSHKIRRGMRRSNRK